MFQQLPVYPGRDTGIDHSLAERDPEARSRLEARTPSTEDLRLALRRYREFFQRLLAV